MPFHSLPSQWLFEGVEVGVGTGFPGRGVMDPPGPLLKVQGGLLRWLTAEQAY